MRVDARTHRAEHDALVPSPRPAAAAVCVYIGDSRNSSICLKFMPKGQPPVSKLAIGTLWFSWVTGESLKEFAGWALLIGAVAIPTLVVLTKLCIRLKYRLRSRSGFGTETSYSMADTGIT